MDNVVQFGGSGPSHMTVIELAIIVALLRLGPSPLGDVAPMLAQWFAGPIAAGHLSPVAAHMVEQGWLRIDAAECFRPASAALAPTQQLYAGFIRMLGDGLEPVSSPDQLSLFQQFSRETDHDRS